MDEITVESRMRFMCWICKRACVLTGGRYLFVKYGDSEHGKTDFKFVCTDCKMHRSPERIVDRNER